jgi:ADP-ribose pyrophosphatase YjhB (NUDIX family)
MSRILQKVTALVVRETARGREVLLFEHPYAGNQIPAGTVEEGESPDAAVLREAFEETGLNSFAGVRFLGVEDEKLPDHERVVVRKTTVYARPDAASFDWAYLPRGATVEIHRQAGGFAHVTYIEYDRLPDWQYVSWQITGWVPEEVLADTRRRHFYELRLEGNTPERWTATTDNHVFTLFWAPLDALPPIIQPQDQWVGYLR